MSTTLPVATATDIAQRVDLAAHYIERHGLNEGDYWPRAIIFHYVAGLPCDIAGGLAAACGITNAHDMTEFLGLTRYDPKTGTYHQFDRHPALVAVMRALNCAEIGELFRFSDSCRVDQAVQALRGAAAQIRMRGAL